MQPLLVIREATAGDVDQMVRVMCDSIRDLCGPDHNGAEAPLKAWLANKTRPSVRTWIEDRDNHILVADVDGEVAAVGGLRGGNRVTLNYVAPRFRLQGVSKAMMKALERRAAAGGVRTLSLESTATARPFYLARGYIETGPPETKFGLSSFPMSKTLP